MSGSEGVLDLEESWSIVKRRKWEFLSTFCVVVFVGILIAWLLPPVFRAESKVLIERQQVPDDFVATTVTGYVQERIEIISQRTLTFDRMLAVAKEVAYPGVDLLNEADEDFVEKAGDLVSEMIDSLSVDMVDVQISEPSAGNKASNLTVAFTVSYEHSDPQVATRVANALTKLFLDENMALRTEQTEKVTDFLAQESARLKTEISGIESNLQQLRDESFEYLPDQLSQTRDQLQARQDELRRIEGEVAFLESRSAQIRQQISQTDPYIITDRTDFGVLQDPRILLEKARADLKIALQTYTESHPDVKRLKEQVAELEGDISRGMKNRAQVVAPTNPEYNRLVDQQNENDAKLAMSRATRDQLQALVSDASQKVIKNPEVTLKFNALLRDLDRAQKEYSDTKERLYQAQLAQSLEREQKGERFTLLSAATEPRLPDRPNRPGIVLLAIFFGFLSGSARIVISEARDNTIRTSKDVIQVFGSKPIGVIPVIDLTNL
ncbi:MAG: hypothetical protein IPM37_03135 [Hahellaceae bacterium]|nr:hypothetical protein [Hahellaceae bacterium]